MRKGIALRGTLCRKVIKIVWALGGGGVGGYVCGGLFQKNEKFRCTEWLAQDDLNLSYRRRELSCKVLIRSHYTSCFPPNNRERVCFSWESILNEAW